MSNLTSKLPSSSQLGSNLDLNSLFSNPTSEISRQYALIFTGTILLVIGLVWKEILIRIADRIAPKQAGSSGLILFGIFIAIIGGVLIYSVNRAVHPERFEEIRKQLEKEKKEE